MQVGKLGREATATSDEAPAAYIYLFFKPYPWPVAHLEYIHISFFKPERLLLL